MLLNWVYKACTQKKLFFIEGAFIISVSLHKRTTEKRGQQNAGVTNMTGLSLMCFAVIFT